LERARRLPHLHETVDAGLGRGPRDRLCVVARRPGDDAPLPLLRRERGEAVERAAGLERARVLEQLRLQRDAEGQRAEGRRALDPAGQGLAGAVDVLASGVHAGSVSRAATGMRSRTVKTVSLPGWLSTSTLPPIASVSSFTIASPSPVPTGRSRP